MKVEVTVLGSLSLIVLNMSIWTLSNIELNWSCVEVEMAVLGSLFLKIIIMVSVDRKATLN